MSLQQLIESRLRETFSPEHLEVLNESSQHSVPRNSETHFRVRVVSPHFEGQNRVKRHRAVNGALHEALQAGVHALAIEAWTPAQWEARGGAGQDSPACLGGSKAESKRG